MKRIALEVVYILDGNNMVYHAGINMELAITTHGQVQWGVLSSFPLFFVASVIFLA